MLRALDVHRNNPNACKVGSRILGKLASGNVAELVAQLNMATTAAQKVRARMGVLLQSLRVPTCLLGPGVRLFWTALPPEACGVH